MFYVKMARLGVSNLIGWQNARINNPSKLNLIKSSYRYNQSAWRQKVGYRNKSTENGKHDILCYTFIDVNGIFEQRWRTIVLLMVGCYEVKYRFNNCTCNIYSNTIIYRYSDRYRITIIPNDDRFYCFGPDPTRYLWYQMSEIAVNGVPDINLIRSFMQKHEAIFRQI